MPESMTGFGSGRASDGQRELLVEIRAVNHKYCDVRPRLPRDLLRYEGVVNGLVKKRLSRGRVDVTVEMRHLPNSVVAPRINLALARGYQEGLSAIAEAIGAPAPLDPLALAQFPGVLEPAAVDDEDDAKIRAALEAALNDALEGLVAMRRAEGAALVADLERHLADVATLVTQVADEVTRTNGARRDRLERKLNEALGDQTVDPSRLAQEVAILVDRSDVAEETARLDSHVEQFRKQLQSDGAVGRKLDFLLQEMHREANTIGSKSGSAAISHLVVEMKSAVERIREQVQNVE